MNTQKSQLPLILFPTIVLLLLIHQASSIKCFQCSLLGDGHDCSDEILKSNKTDANSSLLISCNSTVTLCMTTIPDIPGFKNIPIRSCAPVFPHFEPRVGCSKKKGGIPGTVCYCKKDMCINSSMNLPPVPIIILLSTSITSLYSWFSFKT